MNRRRKNWYLKNPLLQLLGVLTLIALFYVPIAFATTTPQELEKEGKGSATKNELISIKTTISEVEDKAKESQQDTIRLDVKGLKAERNSLEQQTQKLQEEIDSLKTQLKQKEAEEAKAKAEAEKVAKVKQIKQEAQVKASSTTVETATTKTTQDKTITAVATAYTAYCNGCSGTTANGTDLRANPSSKVIAVDPRVIPLNSKVEVIHNGKSLGVFTAGDTGGAIKGNKIDIFMSSQKAALNWGVKEVTLKVKK